MDLSNITEVFKKKFPTLIKDEMDINWGFCYWWAYVAYCLFGGDLISYDDESGHAFVCIEGIYYDSESPKGVSHWSALKFFQEEVPVVDEDIFLILEEDVFVEHWSAVGGRGWCCQTIEDLIGEVSR